MKKILVVDDDPVVVKLLSEILESNQYEVVTSKDGLDALVKLKEEAPDLVVLDIELPEVNGYDICYQLRFNEDFEKIPIILLTVRDKEIDDKISERVNIDYIPKPVDSKRLLKVIDKFLS